MAFANLAFSYLLFSVLHLFCFALALSTIGLYGVDLNRAHKHGVYSDSKWVSPEGVGQTAYMVF